MPNFEGFNPNNKEEEKEPEFVEPENQFHGNYEEPGLAPVLNHAEELSMLSARILHKRHETTEYHPDNIEGQLTVRDLKELSQKSLETAKSIEDFIKKHEAQQTLDEGGI